MNKNCENKIACGKLPSVEEPEGNLSQKNARTALDDGYGKLLHHSLDSVCPLRFIVTMTSLIFLLTRHTWKLHFDRVFSKIQ